VPPAALALALVAAIALWVVVRFPALAPRTAFGVGAWLGAAVTLTIAARPTFALLGTVAGPIAALVVVELASGVCMMLAVAWTTIWILRAAAPTH
jgi:hypothetical protein